MQLSGKIFLSAKFRLVSCPQIWERTDCACEIHIFLNDASRWTLSFPILFELVPRTLGEFDISDKVCLMMQSNDTKSLNLDKDFAEILETHQKGWNVSAKVSRVWVEKNDDDSP